MAALKNRYRGKHKTRTPGSPAFILEDSREPRQSRLRLACHSPEHHPVPTWVTSRCVEPIIKIQETTPFHQQ